MFSLITTTWTDVRNKMDMKTVESCLIMKMYELSCMKFQNKVLKNHSYEYPQYIKVYKNKKLKLKIATY